MFTISYAWLGVIMTAVFPAGKDLSLLSEAAASRRPDSLLERYPDLRAVPEQERGRLLHDKIMAGLMARVPLGIWLMMLYVVAVTEIVCVSLTMVAGRLLRRQGSVRTCLLPYAEVVLPGVMLISVVFDALFTVYFQKFVAQIWHGTLVAALVLAVVAAVRGWHWAWRLAFQVAWIVSLGLLWAAKLMPV
jgi:hypothetical protein